MSRIDISSEQHKDGFHVVRPAGKLDVFSFIELKKFFEELCKDGVTLRVLVDLAAVEYIASSGWSVLLARRQSIRRNGGDLIIFGLSENLKRVYDTMMIDDLLPQGPDLPAAVKLFTVPVAE
jgi:anti-anti-sigma factor